MFKNNNIKKYKKLIDKIILNEKIKEEIIEKIDYFNEKGEIALDGYCLYAKNGQDFLDLKYENNSFLCNYSDWEFAKFVTIFEKELKNKCVKLERKEKIEYECEKNENMTRVEELEEVYDSSMKLIYESKLQTDYQYNTFNNCIEYIDNHYFTNYFDLDKKWYIDNGSIINYKLSKFFMNDHSNIQEQYSICPKAYIDCFGTYYNYVTLDEELFKQFMSGNITIDEVLEKIDKEEFHKSLRKSISHVEII